MSLSTTIGTVAVIQRADPYWDLRAYLSCWVGGVETVRAYIPELDTNGIYSSGVPPAMSPDGRWLAYPTFGPGDTSPCDVPLGSYILDTASGALTWLPEITGASYYSNRGAPAAPWWAADGRLVSADGRYTWRPGSSPVRTPVDIVLGQFEAVIPVPNCNGLVRISDKSGSGTGTGYEPLELYDLDTGALRATAEVPVGAFGVNHGAVTYVYATGVQDAVVVV